MTHSGMAQPESHPMIGIYAIGSETPRNLLLAHAIQLSAFTANIIHPYYEQTLQLQRIDPEPRPNYQDNEEIMARVARLTGSGPVEQAGKRYWLALHVNHKQHVDLSPGALAGILIMSKPGLMLCDERGHTATEIDEFDVAPDYRGKGVGRVLLRTALQEVHPEDMLTLDVARPNHTARAIYERYGFDYADVPAVQHGIFDVDHLVMQTPAHMLQRKLDI